MNKIQHIYSRCIHKSYWTLYCLGEVFVTSMERNIREVENAEKLRERGTRLKRKETPKQSIIKRIKNKIQKIFWI